MIREENFQTTVGLNTKAANVLWNLTKNDRKSRLHLMKLFSNYSVLIKNIDKDYWYLSGLVLKDYIHNKIPNFNPKYQTYIENILKTIRKSRWSGKKKAKASSTD